MNKNLQLGLHENYKNLIDIYYDMHKNIEKTFQSILDPVYDTIINDFEHSNKVNCIKFLTNDVDFFKKDENNVYYFKLYGYKDTSKSDINYYHNKTFYSNELSTIYVSSDYIKNCYEKNNIDIKNLDLLFSFLYETFTNLIKIFKISSDIYKIFRNDIAETAKIKHDDLNYIEVKQKNIHVYWKNNSMII